MTRLCYCPDNYYAEMAVFMYYHIVFNDVGG